MGLSLVNKIRTHIANVLTASKISVKHTICVNKIGEQDFYVGIIIITDRGTNGLKVFYLVLK